MSASKLPDGPQTLSLLQKFQWITKPLELLEKQAQIYDDIFILPSDRSIIPQVIVSNPEAGLGRI